MQVLIRRAIVALALACAPQLAHAAADLGPTPAPDDAAAARPAEMPAPQNLTPQNLTPQTWAIHGQSTLTEQYHPGFASPYRGVQSLDPGSRGDETLDVTLYGGVRPWHGAEIWINPEVEQGFGLSNTFGVAGFPSGESYKLGAAVPYVRLQRLFLRQTINLGGELQAVDPDLNQLGGSQTANRVVLTAGKFSVVDIFDTNKFAHDPRNDFMNWSLIDAGNFDYAGDAWGYTYGAAVEWYQDWWTIRGGIADMPTTPGYKYLDVRISQLQYLLELEERHTIFGQDGKLKLTGFLSRGELGGFNQAVAFGAATGTVPDTNAVLRYRSKGGASLNLEQQVTADLGMFARAGMTDNSAGTDAFTDIGKSLSIGLSLTGKGWNRPADTVGLAVVENDISRHFKNYLNAGGVGLLIGDGQLPSSGPEQIAEIYYSLSVTDWAKVTADYEFINHPAYATRRGPVSVLGSRLHVQF